MNKRFYLLFFFIYGLTLNSFAQKQKVKSQPYGDHRLYHFGLTVGFNFQDMILANSGYRGENGQVWNCEIPDYSTGFNVGLIADRYINPYLNLRFTPTMHFGDKSLLFQEETTGETFKTNVRSNYLTFPIDIKYSSIRLNNCRPYFLGGLYAAMDLGTKKGEPILLKPMDYGFQIGFGCDTYLPIVKVCPELRFYFGLSDLIEKNRIEDLPNPELIKYTNALSQGASRMIVLTFNFE